MSLFDTQTSLASLAASIYSFCTKWESKLLQFQELKKKEEKFGKTDPKQRMSSGSASGSSSAAGPAAEKSSAADKSTLGKKFCVKS